MRHFERHFGDKIRKCMRCEREILIPFNQIGGFWHLSNHVGKDGKKWSGGVCSNCLDIIDGKGSRE